MIIGLILVSSILVFSISVQGEENYNIPSWIKNNAKWWSEEKIGDSDFLQGIQYLIQKDVMKIPETKISSSGSHEIPKWVKNNAKWWAEGSIGDSDFISGIQYLVQNNIIQIQIQTSDECNPSFWDHVYNPQRLQVIDMCTSVSGIVETMRGEDDGDYRIGLALDSEYAYMINDANRKSQHGNLVVEIICQLKVTDLDAKKACSNFVHTVYIPMLGMHVKVTGSYVLDKDHFGWAEIHPVTKLEVIQ